MAVTIEPRVEVSAGRTPRALLALVVIVLLVPPATWTAESGWRPGDTFSSTLDPWLGFPTAASLVRDGDPYLDEYGTAVRHYSLVETDDGHVVDDFPWTASVPLVPVVLAVDALKAIGVGDGSAGLVRERGWGPIEVVTAAAVVVWATVLAWRVAARLGLDRRTATTVVAAWVLGTMVWSVAGRGLWQHTLLLVPLLGLVLALVRVRSTPTRVDLCTVGALAAGAALVRPAVVPMLAVACTYVVGRARWAAGWTVLGGAAVGGVGLLLTWSLHGGALPPYLDQGSRLGWHPDSAAALGSLVASASRNALLFAPVLFVAALGVALAVRRRDGLVLVLGAAAGVQLFVSTALWDGWWGGFSYGPRFVIDVLPFALVPAAVGARWVAGRPRGPLALAAVLVVGVVVNAPGAITHQAGCWNMIATDQTTVERMYDWSDLQVTYGYRALIDHGTEALVGPCDRGPADDHSALGSPTGLGPRADHALARPASPSAITGADTRGSARQS